MKLTQLKRSSVSHFQDVAGGENVLIWDLQVAEVQ